MTLSGPSGRFQLPLPRKVTILLTGVGAPGTKGTIYALNTNREKVRVRVVGSDLNEDVIGKYWVDKFYKVPAPEGKDYVERINKICKNESIDVIVPQTTRETVALSNHVSELESKVTVSESSAIEKSNNKFELLNLCQELNIPRPRFFLARSEQELKETAHTLGYPSNPVVVKPLVSFGSRGFRVLRESSSWDAHRFLTEKPNSSEISLDELLKIFSKESIFPELLVTQYLAGEEYTVDLFSGQMASVAIPRLRKEIVNGISFRTRLEYRRDIIQHSLKLAKALGLRYAFGFQFKLDDENVPNILECNPRIQGTMVASVFSGINVIWMAVREALGFPVKSIPTRLKVSEFYRYWGGLAAEGRHFIEM